MKLKHLKKAHNALSEMKANKVLKTLAKKISKKELAKYQATV